MCLILYGGFMGGGIIKPNTSAVGRITSTQITTIGRRWLMEYTMTCGGDMKSVTAIMGCGCHGRLTAVLLVTPVGTVAEAITTESSDDTVDPVGTGKERGTTL